MLKSGCLSRTRAVFAAVAFTFIFSLPGFTQDVLTFHNDQARSGVQTDEAILAPSNVAASRFGKTFNFPVTGDVYAQPLFVSQYLMSDGTVHDILLVATQRDMVYAFDAEGNNPPTGYLWQVSLLPPGETWVSSTDVNSSDIAPDIGITGTPVIDRADGTLFVVAKSKTTSGAVSFIQRLHALNLADGSEKLNGPALIQATLPGSGGGTATTVSFNPLKNNQRAALLLASTPGGATPASVFIAWGSHGDHPPYHGWIVSYDATADITRRTGVWTDTPNGTMAGIWMSGSGLASDGSGNFFAATGNGTFDANNGGLDLGDSLIKLTNGASGLAPADWFTPLTQSSLNVNDADFGTAGPLLLPLQSGPIPHLLVTADKTGRIYVLNSDNLGRYTGGGNKDVQDFSDGGYSVHSNMLFFNNALYLAPGQGPLEFWRFNPSTELFTPTPSSVSAHLFTSSGVGGDGSGSNFSISASGAANGVVWAIDCSAYGSGAAVLYAYDASNLSNLLYTSAQAANNRDQAPIAVKFATPTVANGFVYVGGRNSVATYGLLSRFTPPPAAPAPSFSLQSGSYPATQTVVLSDTLPGAAIHYTLNGAVPTLSSKLYSTPLTINSTAIVNAIAYAPGYSASSSVGATYNIASSPGGGSLSYSSGFSAASLVLNGSAKYHGVRLSLTDGGPNQASSAYFPAPLNVQSFVTDFAFQLTKAADGFTFVLQNAGPTAMGSATTGASLGYGPDAKPGNPGLPKSIAVKFDTFNNQGEGPSSTGLYTNGALPTTPCADLSSTAVMLAAGNIMHAHILYNGIALFVTVTDTKTGAVATHSYPIDIPATVGANDAYIGFTAASIDGYAAQEILTWTYSPQPAYSAGMTSANLALNGGAVISGTNLVLTDGGPHEARSAFFKAPVNVQDFTSSFKLQILNPIADGLTFTIQRAGTSTLGGNGGGLGFVSIPNSAAVKFDLYSNSTEGANSTGIYTNGASPTIPAVDLTAAGINFHSGHIFNVLLTYNGAVLTAVITDTVTKAAATQTYTVDIPTAIGGIAAYVGFTGGTGSKGSIQRILNWTYTN